MSLRLFTVGHSTHPLDRFLALLKGHDIKALADIRRFPGSHRFPHFHRDTLATALPEVGIDYHWIEALGGRRRSDCNATSQNLGLRNTSFRNYADYMRTQEFRGAVKQLLEIARRKRTAFMCAEGLYWQCHRRLVSDFLSVRGNTVEHIMPSGEVQPHKLTDNASFIDGELTYPPSDRNQILLFE